MKNLTLGFALSTVLAACGGSAPPPAVEPEPTPEPPPPRREAIGSVLTGTNGTSMLSATVPLDGGHLASFELRGARDSAWVQLSYMRDDAVVLQIGDLGLPAEAPSIDGSQITVWYLAAPFIARFGSHTGPCHIRIAADGAVLDSTDAPESFCSNFASFAQAISPAGQAETFAESDSFRFFQGHTRVLWWADTTLDSGVRNGPSVQLRSLVRPTDLAAVAGIAESAGVEAAPGAAFLALDAPACSDEVAAGNATAELILGRTRAELHAASSAYAEGMSLPLVFALDEATLAALRDARTIEIKTCGERFVRFARPGQQAVSAYFTRLQAIQAAASARTPIADPVIEMQPEGTSGGEAPPAEAAEAPPAS